jgi:hypothetical protein
MKDKDNISLLRFVCVFFIAVSGCWTPKAERIARFELEHHLFLECLPKGLARLILIEENGESHVFPLRVPLSSPEQIKFESVNGYKVFFVPVLARGIPVTRGEVDLLSLAMAESCVAIVDTSNLTKNVQLADIEPMLPRESINSMLAAEISMISVGSSVPLGEALKKQIRELRLRLFRVAAPISFDVMSIITTDDSVVYVEGNQLSNEDIRAFEGTQRLTVVSEIPLSKTSIDKLQARIPNAAIMCKDIRD